MTRTIRILCSLLLVLAVAAPAVAQPGSLKLPPYKKVVLKNGMTLLLMEQREVPLVSFSVLVKAGSVSDPAGKEGVASMTAALLRKGTATRSADEFSAQLDFIGGSFGAGASAGRHGHVGGVHEEGPREGPRTRRRCHAAPLVPRRRSAEAGRPARRRHQVGEGPRGGRHRAVFQRVSLRQASLRPPDRRRRSLARVDHARRRR